MQALKLLGSRQLIGVGWYDVPLLSFWPNALSMAIFGANITGTRLASVFFTLASIPFLYLLTSLLFSKKISLIATLLFTTSHVTLGLGRLGINYSQAFFLIPASLYFLIQGFKKQSILNLSIAGFFSALCLYAYYAARVIFPLEVIIAIYYFIQSKNKIKTTFLCLALIISTAVIAGPQVFFFIQHPSTFSSRTKEVSIFNPQNSGWVGRGNKLQTISSQFRDALNIQRGDTGGQYGYRGLLVDYLSLLLFAVGIIFLLKKRRFLNYLVLTWFGLAFFSQILTTIPSPIFLPRFTVGLAPFFIIISVGVAELINIYRFNSRQRLIATLAIVIFIVAFNLYTFFELYPNQIAGDTNARSATMIASYLKKLPDSYKVIFLTTPSLYADFGTLRFLTPTKTRIHIKNPENYRAEISSQITNNQNLIFVVYPQYQSKLINLAYDFPDGTTLKFNDINSQTRFYIYQTPSYNNQ